MDPVEAYFSQHRFYNEQTATIRRRFRDIRASNFNRSFAIFFRFLFILYSPFASKLAIISIGNDEVFPLSPPFFMFFFEGEEDISIERNYRKEKLFLYGFENR